MNRILTIEEGATGRTWELEAPRVSPYQTGKLLDELAGTNSEHGEEPRAEPT